MRSIAEGLSRLAVEGPGRDLLRAILHELLEILDSERIFLFRMRRAGGFQVLASSNRDLESVSAPHLRISHYAVKKAFVTGRPLHVADARRDRRYRTEEALEGKRTAQSITVLPLRAGGELLGGIYADHRFREMGAPADDGRVRAWTALAELALTLRERYRSIARSRQALEPREKDAVGAAERTGGRLTKGRIDACLSDAPEPEDFHGFLSANVELRDAFSSFRRLVDANLPVLIAGETGTGKSLLARVVHESSRRAGRPFCVFHCGSVPETLIESELHGHVRGAFTGADADRVGLLVDADGGTLLLDEISDMSQEMQTKLLRVLEDGLVRPVGGRDSVRVDVRVVAVTTARLDELVASGHFRRDLFFRLKGIEIEIEPLRERPEDVLPLCERFLERAAREAGREAPRLSAEARRRLLEHSWPGNVRELENEMCRLVALGLEGASPEDLRLSSGAASAARTGGGQLLEDVVGRAEREAVERALARAGGNRSRAAQELGITRKSLYRRIRKYGLESS